MLHRRASGARQREDERRSPVATGRANAARGGALVTGPAILAVSFLVVLSFLYINIYVGNALMNSSAVTEGNEVTVQDESMLTIGFVDDGGNPTTNTTNIALQPTADGVFNSGNVNVNVNTNSPLGYTLTMSASTSSLSRSEAVGNMTPVIPTLTTAVAQADFPNNYWGYKRTASTLDGATEQIADTLYQPMRENYNIPISSTGASASKSISTVNFGVKLDTNTPSGNYNININFLAVSNVAPNLAYMQDATSTSLAAAMPSVGDTTVLYDRRDGQEYTIAKLKDGKYWMTKNLNLAGSTVLTSDDTDMAPGYTMPTTYVDPETGATLPTGFGEGNVLPASNKTGFDNDYKAFIYNTGNNTDTCTNPGCYSYYSWNAATLGSGMDISSDNTDAPYSVCPKDWKLPTSRSTLELAKTSSDFYQMAVHYGLNPADVNENPDAAPNLCNLGGGCSTNTVPRFLRAGHYNGSTFAYGGATGSYWSSTASSSTIAHNLGIHSGLVNSASSNDRRFGFSVRCLFDATMQNFTQEDADAMALHQEEILVDARDGKNYYVTKLKDGNVWMTQNLDFDLDSSVTLTSADTDLNSVSSWTSSNSTVATFGGAIQTCDSEASCWGGYNQNFATSWTHSDDVPSSANPGYRYMIPKFLDEPNPTGQWYANGDTFANCSTQDTNCGGQGHYMIGNYYNFAAANATNSVEATVGHKVEDTDANFVMPDSICPKGWRMPLGQSNNNDFATLFTAYNIYGDGSVAFNYQGLNAARRDPLYFVRSGYVTVGVLHNAGASSFEWSSTISAASSGYYLGFRGTGISPAYSNRYHLGSPVRCLLRTE